MTLFLFHLFLQNLLYTTRIFDVILMVLLGRQRAGTLFALLNSGTFGGAPPLSPFLAQAEFGKLLFSIMLPKPLANPASGFSVKIVVWPGPPGIEVSA